MKNGKIIWGSILVTIGLIFLIDQTNILRTYGITAGYIFGFIWPLMFLAFGIKFLSEKNQTLGVIFTLLGVFSLMSKLFNIDVFSIAWPLIIVAIGVFILIKKDSSKVNIAEGVTEGEMIKEDVVFWGLDRKVTSQSFKGGELTCVFGGGKLDLSEAKIDKDGANLEVDCIFGGVEIIVPSKCKVITNGTGVFGGWSPNISNKEDGPTLTISGSAVFGGVEIKDI